MKLKGRLKLIAEKVPKTGTVCDIGTDHAYIPVYLVENQICKKAIAADVRIGPVQAAQENIKTAGLEDFIDTRLGDGLAPVGEDEADVIVIAGMGGVLIAQILSAGFNKVKNADALILQPMTAIEELREWLYSNGFEINDEELVGEGEKIYDVISAKWTGTANKPDKLYYHVGKRLIDKKDPLLDKYINKKIILVDKAVNGLKKSVNSESEALKELSDLRKKLAGLIKA